MKKIQIEMTIEQAQKALEILRDAQGIEQAQKALEILRDAQGTVKDEQMMVNLDWMYSLINTSLKPK